MKFRRTNNFNLKLLMRSTSSLLFIFSLLFQSTTLAYPSNQLNAAISSAASTLFDGESLTDSLEDHLKTAGINLAGEYAANGIGATYGKASADGWS